MEEEGFISFVCPSCHTEIEASLDMVGEPTECPACGGRIKVPRPEDEPSHPKNADDDGIVRHGPGDDASNPQKRAQKNRTIRIELGDL